MAIPKNDIKMESLDDVPLSPRLAPTAYSSHLTISAFGDSNFLEIVKEFKSIRGFNWRSVAIYSVVFQIFFGTVFLSVLMIWGTMQIGFHCCTWDSIREIWNVTTVYDPILDFSDPTSAKGHWTISQTMAFDPLRVLGSFLFYGNGVTLLAMYYTRLTILSMLHLDDRFVGLFRTQLIWGHISAFSAYLSSVVPWSNPGTRLIHGGAAFLYLLGNYFFLFSAAYMENHVDKHDLSDRKWALLGTEFWRKTRLNLSILSFLFSALYCFTYLIDSRYNIFEWVGVLLITLANGTFLPQFRAMRSVIIIFPKTNQVSRKNGIQPITGNIESDITQLDPTKIGRGSSAIPNNNKLVVDGIGNREFVTIFNHFGRLRGCNWRLVAIISMVIQILFAIVFLPSTMAWATTINGTCCPKWDPITKRYNVTKILDPILDLNWEEPRPGSTWTISQVMEFDPLRIWGECWFGLLGISLWVMYNMRITILSMLRLDEKFPWLFRIQFINGIISSVAAAIPSIFPSSVAPWIHQVAYFTYLLTNYIFTFSSAYMENYVIDHFTHSNKMTDRKWMLLGTKTWRIRRLLLGLASIVCVLIFIIGSLISDPRLGIFEWLGVLLICLSNATFLPQFWQINTAILTF